MTNPDSALYFIYVVIGLYLTASGAFLWTGFSAQRRRSIAYRPKMRNSRATEPLLEVELPLHLSHLAILEKLQLAVQSNTELMPKPLAFGKSLTRTAASLAMANIEHIVKEIAINHNECPHLFGVNKGGSLVANWIGHRLDLHEKFLVKCDWNVTLQRPYLERRIISGPIVILDDLSRTGATLKSLRTYVEKMHPDSAVYCMALAASTKTKQPYVPFQKAATVDYAAWYTDFKGLTLPWSSTTSETLNAGEFFTDDEMDQVSGRLTVVN